MQDDEIMIELAGPHGEIDPRAVADAITALDKILRNLASDEPPKLSLSMLATGSATAGVRCDPRLIETLRLGMTRLSSGPYIPDGWSVDSVNGLIDLQNVEHRRGVNAVRLKIGEQVSDIDETLAAHAAKSIEPGPPSLGSVRGLLYRYNNDLKKRSAGLRDYRTGQVVNIVFPIHLAALVRGGIDHEVEAWGEVRRNGHDVVSEISIRGIEVVDSSRAAVALDEVAGIFGPDWTDGIDTVEWVRRQRG